MIEEPRVDSASCETTAGAGATVLVLDDEPCISELLVEMLRIIGFSPTKCSSPEAALALLEQQEFDVILSDFRMPQMNGDEFFRRAVGKNAAVKSRMIFLTGDTMSEDTQLFLSEHGCRHLSKPFDLSSVEQMISETIAQQKTRNRI